MKIFKKFIRVIVWIVFILNIFTFQISYNTNIDKSIAKEILREAYMPLENFIKSGIPIEDKELLEVPEEVKNKSDFIKLFKNKIETKMVEEIFEELIIEKEGQLYIDKTLYIPALYSENSIIDKSYIKTRNKSLYLYITGKVDTRREELIVKGKNQVDEHWSELDNFFIKNENGKWILEGSTGTVMHGFVDPDENPWYQD